MMTTADFIPHLMLEKTSSDSSWRYIDKVTGQETRDKLYKGRFQLDIRNNIFTEQAVTNWTRLARGVFVVFFLENN